MKQSKNSESRRIRREPRRRRPGEPVISSADWEPPDWHEGRPGEPSPHLKPGEKGWMEVEEERLRQGLPPRYPAPAPPEPRPPKRTGTGFFYKNGDEMPPTHPDHGPMNLLPRQEDGSFATYYYCSQEELDDFGIDGPPPRRHRRDGLTPERIETFIRTLRATASVTDAARAAGCSRQAFYDLYNSADAAEFRRAWGEALRGPNIVLTSTAYDRAVNGVEEIVYYQGQRIGTRTKYDNRLLMWLLRVRDPLNFAPLDDLQGWLRHREVEPHQPIEPTLDRLAAAEEEWGRRLPGEAESPVLGTASVVSSLSSYPPADPPPDAPADGPARLTAPPARDPGDAGP